MARPIELPYDTATGCAVRLRWFERARALGWAVYLDSGGSAQVPGTAAGPARGRYDVIAAGPRSTVAAGADAFARVRELLRGCKGEEGGWPLAGGAIGYFAYELGRSQAGLQPAKAGTPPRMPDFAFGLYPWTAVIDHREKRAAITSLADVSESEVLGIRERLLGADVPAREAFRVLGEPTAELDRKAYLPRAARVIAFIREGDCYQANLSREFRVACAGDPWELYRHLHDTNPAPMGAYLEYPFGAILSSSPERFLSVDGREAVTRPIKGTRKRREDPAQDAAAQAELRASEKDRAENVMIVDLMRNDFGRVCEASSVAAPEICVLESFATVHHLVSTVTGRLAPGRDALDLLEACFPGGSITGAPKRRAMQIIDALEPHRREVYCGAIGYIAPSGRMDMSIPIRTTLCVDGELRFYAGGGIVADSTPEDEYIETEVKVTGLTRTLARFATSSAPHPEKAALRLRAVEVRETLPDPVRAAFAERMTQRLRELPEYRAARRVLATFSIGSEWSTRAFAEGVLADGKMLVMPRVVREPRSLELYVVRDLAADLKPGVWGIEEPDPAKCERVRLSDVQFALVPALAADREGYRLGYGAGYFDRLLAREGPGPEPFCVVALPAPLVFARVPREVHDVAVDAVATEREILRMKGEKS